MFQQIKFFYRDYLRLCGAKKIRMLYIWVSRAFAGIFIYRFERSMFLLLGKGWKVLRIPVSPLLNMVYAYSNCEIHYQADIGPGICILHTAPGVVISARSKIGNNLTLVGGNIIGIREDKAGPLQIGDSCYLGANAVILGPVTLGSFTRIGACSLVLHDSPGNTTLIGSPAHPVP